MRIILNGSLDIYEDGIDFEDLEVEIVDECDIDDGFFYDDYDEEECDGGNVILLGLANLLALLEDE